MSVQQEMSFFRQGSRIYPQPIAVACGHICRARHDSEKVHALIKCAEILTRYLAAGAISAYRSRTDSPAPKYDGLDKLSGNLSFGQFLAVLQEFNKHPSNNPLGELLKKMFSTQSKGVPSVLLNHLQAFLELRNRLGHDLASMQAAKASAILIQDNLETKLQDALEAADPLLARPLFVVEDIHRQADAWIARRLFLMGESNPIPEGLVVKGSLRLINSPYIELSGWVFPLPPLLIWDLAPARYCHALYFIHRIHEATVEYISVFDDTLTTNSKLFQSVQDMRAGLPCPAESALAAEDPSWEKEWQQNRRNTIQALGLNLHAIDWRRLQEETVMWYARQIDPTVDAAPDAQRLIRQTLLDGREQLDVSELRQIELLLGKPATVQAVLGRELIDCRARSESSSARWAEREEITLNLVEALRRAIAFLGRHIGVDGVTLEGLKATTGTADYIATREGLINLFIHQDYADNRTVAQVETSENETVFFNAGRSLVSQKALIEGGRSQSRNPIISRAFKRIGFAELAGSGLREVHRVWRNAKRRPPKTESNPSANTFTLMLDWRPLPEDVDIFWKEKLGVRVSTEQARLLSLSREPRGFSMDQYASATGRPMDDVQHDLDYLVRQTLLIHEQGAYRLSDHLVQLMAPADVKKKRKHTQ